MQREDDFEWDVNNEEKLFKRHGVDRYEAEQAATDPGAYIKRIGRDQVGNPEYIFVGKTDDGRILFMVGVCKKAEPGASGVLEMQSSKRRDLTESEMDEPKSKANRQS